MAEVLLYNIRQDYDIERFKEIAKANDIAIRFAEKDDIDQKVGYLIGLPEYEKTEDNFEFDEDLDFDFILFIGFERDQLFAFLDLMRENSLTIQHKANETHNNVNWTLRELLIENDREGKMMGLIHRINGLMAHGHKLQEAYGVDDDIVKLTDEIQEYFDNSNIFEFEVAEKYHSRLRDEMMRYQDEKGIK